MLLENSLPLTITIGLSVKNNDIVLLSTETGLCRFQQRSASLHLGRWELCFAHIRKQDQDFRTTKQCRIAFLVARILHMQEEVLFSALLSFSAGVAEGRILQKEYALQKYFIQQVSCLPADHHLHFTAQQLHCQLCYNTYAHPSAPRKLSSTIALWVFCFITHTMPLQHSTPAASGSTSLAVFTLGVKENPFKRKSISFNRKGWFYTKYCGEV